VGIPPEQIPMVFDVFYTTKEGGSGLGLSITRRLVEDLGGTITMDSTVGTGTTTLISLPMAQKSSHE
jgi:signal transduction histidine kinase